MRTQSKITILNVSNNETVRQILSRTLDEAGFQVKEAVNGQEAIRLPTEETDLIVIDVDLPDLSGFELCQRFKSDPATTNIPILFLLSPQRDNPFIIKGMEGSADGYLTLPIEPSILIASIHALLLSRQEKETLRKRERFISNIVKSVQDGISILDMEMNIVFVNPTMKKWYAHALPLIGKKCYTAYHGRSKICEVCPTSETLEKIKHTHCTVPKRGENSEIIGWLDLHSFPLIDTDTGQMMGVIEHVRDISDQKQAEGALRQAEEKYRSIFENAVEGIFQTTPDGRFISANPALASMLGYASPDEMITQITDIGKQIYAQPEDRQKFRRLLEKGSILKAFETEHLCKDGSKIWVSMNVRAVHNEKGKLLCYEGTYEDITFRKQAEEKLRSLSLIDDLTGLYNRRGFFTLAEQELKRAKRMKQGMMLIYADMDNMKGINDTFGHLEGDLALVDVANIMRDAFREQDIITRIGGDEFVILAIEGASETDAEILISRLQGNLAAHNQTGGRRYKVSMSLGTAYFDPDNPFSIDDLISQADRKMYENKKKKRMDNLSSGRGLGVL